MRTEFDLFADGIIELISRHAVCNEVTKDLIEGFCGHTLNPACPDAATQMHQM